MTPGLLYVTMAPSPSLPPSKFHDWYNNEHGPTRLRLPFISTGFRYRATDLPSSPSSSSPEWMALYDITSMDHLTQEPYLRLRDPPVKSQREIETMSQITVGRKLYDFISSRESPQFKKLEEVKNEGEGNVMIAVHLDLFPGEENKAELDRWYAEEHIDLLSKIPGWLRTRRFVTSSIDTKAPVEYLALHEYEPINGLGGEEFKAATTSPWSQKIMSEVVKEKRRRVWGLYYTFGPAPRYLGPDIAGWELSDPERKGGTKIFPSSSPEVGGAIESWITTPDGVDLQYRLEGSTSPDAPMIVLANSILVDWGIWDSFLISFFSTPSNRQFRILRYLKRGRSANYGKKKVTIDVLAEDVVALMDALRVRKAAAVIGVSLGGATVLNVALKYPERVGMFVSCDTSSKSPAGNAKAWGERIAVAEKEGKVREGNGEKIVGGELAEMTTRRWFVKESYDGGAMEERIKEVKGMVEGNSLEGFRGSVEALFEYDMRDAMKGSQVKGAFMVGSGDGVLPGTMKEMAAAYGANGAEYKVIEGAGHLPMVEKPKEFADFITEFLKE